jgi:hypothetical protein
VETTLLTLYPLGSINLITFGLGLHIIAQGEKQNGFFLPRTFYLQPFSNIRWFPQSSFPQNKKPY